MIRRSVVACCAILLLTLFLAVYAGALRLYPRYFDIEWDEEVQLHDGSLIIVHVKNTYERLRSRLNPYDTDSIKFRRKTIEFESQIGQKVIISTRMPVAYLGRFDGRWYIVISGQGPYGNFPDENEGRWGDDFTTLEQRLAILRNGEFTPIDWEQSPPYITSMNLMRSAFWSEFLQWNKGILTLSRKQLFNDAYPTSYRNKISRPIRMTESIRK